MAFPPEADQLWAEAVNSFMKILNSKTKNTKMKSGSIQLWTGPGELNIRRALASEVLREVDNGCLKGVRVLLHLLLDDVEKGVVEDGADDLFLTVRATGEV